MRIETLTRGKSEAMKGMTMLGNIQALARGQVYECPTAAITHYHTLSGFKQHTFILLQFWQPEVSHGSHWAKIKVSVGLRSSWHLRGENLFLCLFKLLEAPCIPWLTGFFLRLHSQLQWADSLSHCHLSPNPSSTFKDSGDDNGPTRRIQDNLPINETYFTHICKFTHSVNCATSGDIFIFTGSRDYDVDISRGGALFHLPHCS